MKSRLRQVALLGSIVILLGGTAPLPAGMQRSGLSLMPPHPGLLEEYEAGRMPVPDFIANPDLWRSTGIDSPAEPMPLLGSLNALAVVVDFSDKVKTVTASYFDTLVFAVPVAGRGSVYDYFDEISYGQIDIVTVTLPSSMGWIRAPQTYAYYVDGAYCINGGYPNNCQKLAEDIVDAVDSVVNFDNYDNNNDGYAEPIMLVHAGRGAEYTGSVNDVWSHSWSLHTPRKYDGVWISSYIIMPEYWSTVSASTSDMTIGVFAHEMGHGFWGLPDLYDRDYSSRGIGRWSLMSYGSWNGGTAAGGDSPAWPDAWSRVQMGILSPTNISTNATGRSIPQALNNPSPAETVLKLDSAALGAQEYYLVENRQQVSGAYDQYLPGEGLFIWHVDEAMWSYSRQNDYECETQPNYTCSDSAHYLVRLAQADGLLELENKTDQGDSGDPFPGTTTNRNFTMATDPESSSYYSSAPSCIGVTNISDSLATMTADLQVVCAPIYKAFLPLVLRSYTSPTTPPLMSPPD
jgi:immune inhibitor A